MNARRGWLTFLAVATIALFGATELAAQEGSRVQGQATNAATGQPLAGAQVFIPGTGLGTLTNEEGRFLLLNVPTGERTIRLELIGYRAAEQVVNIGAGETVTVNFELTQSAISLDELVVTGVAGETEKAKLPFTVDQLETEDMPVPQANAVSSLQGKVAGATVVQGSGRPGDAPSVLLRGATSINSSGRDQEPLYIVDGVILGSSVVDIDGLDIENIEVVKGAAAASLYGSRAGNGVIQITTKRGRSVADNRVRYTLRSEMGMSQLAETPPSLLSEHHQWALTGDGGQFLSESDEACEWLACPSVAIAGSDAWDTYAVHEWPGGARDQVAEVFTDGNFGQHYISASGRTGATNFHASYSYTDQEGVLPGISGFQRQNFRVNVDQAVDENIHVSASAFYSRSNKDEAGARLFDLTRMPAGVDLWSCDPYLDVDATDCSDDPENLLLVPDPTNTESPNPIYQLLNEDDERKRGRFLGSTTVRYSPVTWFNVDANLSYDRLDNERSQYYPKGYRTPNPSATLNEGNLYRFSALTEAFNGSATASFRFNLTDDIRNSTQLRYLYERDDYESTNAQGYEFAVGNVPTLDNVLQSSLDAGSYLQQVRADGYFLITNFDVSDRYVIDLLARNDGSSLFGLDERRHWYYRVGGAWRLSEEPWFTLPGFNEFKLRYSLGTAGNRPRFVAQYETFNVDGGRISPVALGNKKLKPEFSREQEIGLDAVAFDGRIGLTLTYANTNTSEQILPVPLLGPTGYQIQYQNAGTLESTTWEGSLEAQLAQTADLSWSARLIFDKTKSEITEISTAPFTYGVGGQGLGSVFYAAPGEELGNFYGLQFAETCGHLPSDMDLNCADFQINDQGLLVWTGGDPLSANNWGEAAGFSIFGQPVMWGTPIAGECTDKRTGDPTYFCQVGNSMPDYNVSLSSDLSYRGFSLYALVDAVQGFDVYNQPLQWAVFRRTAGIYDQADVPEAERKPLGYWDATYGVSGLRPSSYFVEDASFVKLREVSLRYTLGQDKLGQVPGLDRLSGLTLMAVGRNILTSTDYRGYDPEVGRGGGATGSAAIARVDGYQYPNFRTWTLGVEVNF